jgi:Mlc titration factor MtfA (ptsG expression regulator)
VNGSELQATWPLTLLAALLGAGGFALLLLQPWWTRRRRRALRLRPFPRAWKRILERRVPLAQKLPPPLRRRLLGLIQVFLADKPFIGCGGQAIDDEVRVTVAAQACLLLLGQTSEACYPRLRQVLVYPGPFVVPRRQLLPGGVVDEQPQLLAGESWAQGQVVLAWSEVLAGAADPADGRNVVLHEFAHQIDQDSGEADGRPWQHDALARQRWAAALDEGLARLRGAVSDTFDAYGGSHPAEFFAVATEAFFERPADVAADAPALYQALSRLYRLDPQRW